MRNILIVFTLMLLAQRIYGSGSDVVNCAGCFAQKWNWASWQCDVHCNVQTSKYAEVDGFSATFDQVPGNDAIIFTANQPVVFNNAFVNINGRYDVTTGIFTVTVSGIYHISLTGFSKNQPAAMIIKLDRNGSTITLGWNIVGGGFTSSTTSLLYELVAGDKLYTVGEMTGHVLFVSHGQETRNMFTAFLVYKSLA